MSSPRKSVQREWSDDSVPPTPTESTEDVVATKHGKHKAHKRRSLVASRRFLFPLGLFLGTLLTYFILPPILPPHLSLLLEDYDLFLPPFPNITLPALEFEWRHLTDSFVNPTKRWLENRDFKVGDEMHAKGLQAEFPIIIVPGIISTGLESWSTSLEYRSYFRKRLWGTTTMVRAVVSEKEKWVAALSLDPETGLDPPGVKIRAAQGIDAASTFIPGYWIWSKVIENLACINYDTNNLLLASYDWRLSYYNLEVRDGYFSRLKYSVESFKKRQGKKVVLVGHSMGSTVILYFLKWVEAPGFGDGGPTWVEDHIESVVNIAGTLLGVPKAMTAFISGEMKDTVEINPAGSYVLEKFFSRKERAKLFRSWAGAASMWLKGGTAVWGNSTHAPDDQPNAAHTYGNFFAFRAPSVSQEAVPFGASEEGSTKSVPIPARETNPGVGNLTATEAGDWILEHTPSSWQRMVESNYSNGIERDPKKLEKNNLDHRKWVNPLEVTLPLAPSLTIYCLYGYGKETERSYWYARGEYEYDDSSSDAAGAVCLNGTDCSASGYTPREPLDLPLSRQNWIDANVHDDKPSSTPKIKRGVNMGEGDGTVSLISLGGMCVEGWKRKTWNPAGIRVVTKEMEHLPEALDPRGGATTSDHIDILGSQALNEAVLQVAAGRGSDIKDHFVSNIREYAKKIAWGAE